MLLVAVARRLNLLDDTICIPFRPSRLVRLMIPIFELVLLLHSTSAVLSQ